MPENDINKIIANNLNRYLAKNDKSQVDLSTYMNVSQATVSNWCKGLKMPRMDKIDRICDFLHCKRSDLMEEKEDSDDCYYLNEDAKEMAQFLYDNPEYKVLFDASRKVKKDDIDFVKQMIDRVRGDDNDTGC